MSEIPTAAGDDWLFPPPAGGGEVEKNIPQLEVVDLDDYQQYQKDLGLGFMVKAVAPIKERGLLAGFRYHLLKDGECIYEFDMEEPAAEYLRDRHIFSHVEARLEECEGKEITCWMKDRFLKNPKVIPPWERKEPIHSIKPNVPLPADPFYRDILTNELKRASDSLNDIGNADRFEQEADGWLIYDRNSKEWFAWNVNHWEKAEEKLGRTEKFIAETLNQERTEWERIYADVGDTDDKSRKKIAYLLEGYFRHYHSTAKNCNLKSMADLCARSTMSVDLKKEKNPHILTFRNGAVNTQTGEMIPIWECDEMRKEYPTVYVDCEYVEEDSEIWKDHLEKVFTDNTTTGLTEDEREKRRREATGYFMRLLGYTLYAGNPEQFMVFLWGEGVNGKSVTVDALKRVWGVEKLDVTCRELFTSNDDRPRSGIAKALPKRVLLLTEAGKSESGGKDVGIFSSSTIKILTGEIRTSEFREMYKVPEEDVRINCFPLATTNALPRFDNTDEALLRRIITIPFQHKFTEEERDLDITEKLGGETNRIFSMMVRELQKYLTDGLKTTPIHFTSTRVELLVGAQICEFLNQNYAAAAEGGTKTTELQAIYIDWCETYGYEVSTRQYYSKNDDATAYNGGRSNNVVLSQREARLLYLGARELFGSFKSMGMEKFRCKYTG